MEPDAALDWLAQQPSRTGVFCDFDGTLSLIVDRPEAAVPFSGAVDVLERLANELAVVALISGRGLGDLSSRVAPAGVILAASYGRQRSDRPGLAPLRAHRWEDVAAEAERETDPLDGVVIERKEAGVALHYRGAPEHRGSVDRIAEAIAVRHGLEVQVGRMVAELVPPGPGKGDALRDLVREHALTTFLYMGDDVSDLHALAWARASGKRCVFVGVGSGEAPAELVSEADLVLDGPPEVVAFLERLNERLRRPD